MPRNVPKATYQLGRSFDKEWWRGCDEFEHHDNAKAFAKFCRANGVRARVVKLPESRQWHGALERSVVYVPHNRTIVEADKYRDLLHKFLEERNLERP